MGTEARVKTTPGRLIVLSGPSGVGKDTVLKRLFELQPSLRYSVSYTTRAPRPGEKDGESYSFVTQAEFDEMVKEHHLLEYAQVHGYWYGTSEQRVRAALERGEDIVLKIDVQGAAWIRPRVSGAIFVFLLPPSVDELHRRLIQRDTEDATSLQARMADSVNELQQSNLYDYHVINDDVDRAAREILKIVEETKNSVSAP